VLDTGAVRQLTSTAGALPGSVWPTFYTMQPPGAHGIYHHLQWDPRAMRLRRVTAEWLYSEPFWCDLERRGLRVAAIDVPGMFPSRLERGIEIVNWGSHDQLGPLAAEPEPLSSEIRRRFGRHPMGYEIPVMKTPAQLERIRRALVAGARRKAELSRWVLSLAEWDFFLTVFGETHRGGHILWPDAEAEEPAGSSALLDVYRAVDQGLGELLEAAAAMRATVVVFSLHGMGPNTSQEHFVVPMLERLNARFMGAHAVAPTAAPPRQRSLMRVLRERLPAALQHAVAQAVPVSVRDLVVDRQFTAGHDWERTPGFALLADLNGYLRLNIRGREARGMLDRGGEALERYRHWLVRSLTSLRIEETGEPLVGQVLFTEGTFGGPRSEHLPDVVLTWTGAPPAARIRSDLFGTFTAKLATGRGGNHRPDGFCAVLGSRGTDGAEPPQHIHDLGRIAFDSLLT
jgi:predicted AlkP superfamily phosphohydrolase/phosphomutase